MRVKDARQTFVGVWIRHVIEGRPFEVWGGEQLRDFTFVEDCVDALLLAAQHPAAVGKCFNLGGTAPVSLLNLAELLVRVHGGGDFVSREFPTGAKTDRYRALLLRRFGDTQGSGLAAASFSGRRDGGHTRYYQQHLPHYV